MVCLGRRVDELFDNSPTRCWFNAPRELPKIVPPVGPSLVCYSQAAMVLVPRPRAINC